MSYREEFREELRLENSVVWLEDASDFDYIREIPWVVVDPYQIPPLLHPGYRMIAFTRLVPGLKEVEGKNYMRRYFELRPVDRDSDPNGTYSRESRCCPSEAVEPKTVSPGVPGRRTSRCKRGY